MKKCLLVVMVLLMAAPMAFSRDVGGKNIPDTLSAGNNTLYLNGAGIREKWFLDIYVGGLYLTKKTQDVQYIINADEPMAVKVHVISGLMSEKKMEDAYREGFEKATGGNMAAIKDRLEEFIAAQKGEPHKDDVSDFVYVPSEGLKVYRNGKMLATIKGLDFKKAYFAMYFGDDPADEGLKEAMLGK